MPEIVYLKSEIPPELSKIRDFLRNTKNFFAIADSEKIVSEVQIRASLDHVARHTDSKIRDPATLLMLFLSGEPHISRAYQKVGITQSTRSIVVIHDDPEELSSFLNFFTYFTVEGNRQLPEDCPESDSLVFGNMSKVELEL